MKVTAQGLRKTYGTKTAVQDVGFTVAEGKVTGFLGPNGAGKSTTMRMLLDLDRPDRGHVRYDGRRLVDHPAPLHLVGSLLDAKAFNPRATAHQHLSALAATHGLGHRRVDHLLALAGLSEVAGRRVGTYSLGMSQRLGIASAMVADPQVLVLDEPVNGLDPDGVRWVRETVRSLADEGRTILLSSHLMSEMAQTADHVIVLGRGRVIADTPIDQLLGEETTTRVRSPRISLLAGLLIAEGARVDPVDATTAVVSGADSTRIGTLAATHGIVLVELVPQRSSLEDAYLQLTADAVEYPTGART